VLNRYVISAALIITAVFSIYFINFYIFLGYKISDDVEKWAQLGDYAGGIINPLLSFVSIVLLIKSLTLQNEASISLRNELKNSEQTEKLRSFETLFFNIINSQKQLFESFKIKLHTANGDINLTSVEAVITIESEIEILRENEANNKKIQEYIDHIDSHDQIFGLSRAFYIMILMITEKLSEAEGFSSEDRKAHFQTLVNFTDFAQLRLIMICVQFMDYKSSDYIKSSIEFKEVIEDLGLSFELY
jgi:hypothetical protein